MHSEHVLYSSAQGQENSLADGQWALTHAFSAECATAIAVLSGPLAKLAYAI